MRVLMVSASMDCGGAETHVLTLSRALSRLGHEVIIGSAGGRLAEEWVREGGRHVQIPLRRAPWAVLRSVVRLRRFLRTESPDVIHVHGRLSGILCHYLSRAKGIPMVGTVHARFRVGVGRRLCRWGARSVAVSEDLKQYLIEAYGVRGDRVRVVPNGIDTDRFLPSRERHAESHRLLFLSRLDRDCSLGAELLCQLAESLCSRDPRLELWIGGDGVCRRELEGAAKEICQRIGRPVIRFVGYIPKPEQLFAQVDGVLGVSRVALEAMSCGLPVILGGDEGWIGCLSREKVAYGAQSNFCCRGEKAMTREALGQAVRELFSKDEAERKQWGRELREYVLEHHSARTMAKETEAVYRAAMPARREGRTTLLCGYYGYGNLGDDALLAQAILRAREQYGEGRVVAMTRRGNRDTPLLGIPCIHRGWLLSILRELHRADRLVFGGGTLLQENTSRRSLWYYTALIGLAKRCGVSVELWANGLGEPKSRWGAARMREALSCCSYLGIRDRASYHIAKEMLLDRSRPPICLERDPAMHTAPCTQSRKAFLLQHYRLNDGTPYAVVAVHGRAGREYLRSFTVGMESLLAQGISLLLLPMYPKEDVPLSRRLAERWGCRVAVGLDAEDTVGLMENCCVVCGMRLHALVFAHCAHAPFVGFGGEEKVRSFCEEWGGVYFTDLYGKGEVGELFSF